MVALLVTHPLVTAWTVYTPQWCTVKGRKFLSDEIPEADKCKKLCIEKNPDCKAIEWWQRHGGICFECTDTSMRCPYNDPEDLANPPHVFIMQEERGELIQDYV